MKRHVDALVRAALRDAIGGGAVGTAGVLAYQVEPPRHAAFGDLTCDVGLALARALGESPHRLAARVVDRLRDTHGWLADVTIDGPGYVNFRFAPGFWRDALRGALEAGPAYGRDAAGAGRRARITVLGASAEEPRTLRATVVAEALARMLCERGWCVDTGPDGGRETGIDLGVGVLGGGRGETVAAFRAGLPAGTPLRILTVAPVRACRDGEPLPRAITAAVLGDGAARFQLLLGRADRPAELDLALAATRGTDNPAWLVGFAHRRLAAALGGVAPPVAPDLTALDQTDGEVLRAVAAWPDVVELAVQVLEPHRIAHWAVQTATAVHRWVNRHRLLSGGVPPPARIALAGCLERIVSRAVTVCGASVPEEE